MTATSSAPPRFSNTTGTHGARRRPLLIRVGRIVGLLVATWLVVTIGVRVAYADQILPRTTMAGLSLGGLSDEAAQRVLTRTLASRRPLTLTAAGRRFVVTPAAVGYRLDIAASVGRARAAGRQGVASGLGATIPSLLAPRKLQPVARIDHARLAAQITAIATTIDRPASAGAVRVDQAQPGGIGLAAPRAQRTLQRAAAGRVLLAALHDRRTGPVALPVRRRGGATPEEMRAVARHARAYLHRPVKLTAGRRKLMLTTRRTAAILALKRQRGSGIGALVLGIDSRAITRLVNDLARDLDHAPSDARISAPARPPVTVDGQGDLSWRPRRADVSVTPGAAGRQLQQDKAVAALTDAVSRGRHRVALSFGREQARITTTAARGVRSLIGTFTTRFPCCQPRVTNIRLIAKDVDGTIVLPGERFSLNEATGERTRADGYLQAPFIADGKIVPSVGGGVSQFSTTLYNAGTSPVCGSTRTSRTASTSTAIQPSARPR